MPSSRYCSYENATIRSSSVVVELHAAINNIKKFFFSEGARLFSRGIVAEKKNILYCCQQDKSTQVCKHCARYCCPILTK